MEIPEGSLATEHRGAFQRIVETTSFYLQISESFVQKQKI